MFCASCGTPYTQEDNYCKNCGATIKQPGNKFEIHLPLPRVASMFWAIGLFSFFGAILSLVLLLLTLNPNLVTYHRDGDKILAGATGVCFAFTLFVTLLLTWELGRYIAVFRNAIKQAIKKEQIEPVIRSQPVLPQYPPLFVPVARESVPTVTEHTTRSITPPLETGHATEK